MQSMFPTLGSRVVGGAPASFDSSESVDSSAGPSEPRQAALGVGGALGCLHTRYRGREADSQRGIMCLCEGGEGVGTDAHAGAAAASRAVPCGGSVSKLTPRNGNT